ncbi:MAG: hypothetical protein RBR15_03030 [Sphaerochaeta sp.]|nr:hypothetical protein [Sphaerochaeta sp.]
MSKRTCSLVSLIIIVASISSAFASENPVRIQIRPASEAIEQIRYQSGTLPDKGWKSAPLDAAPLLLEGFDSEGEFLFVQQAEAGQAWGELYAYQYDRDKDRWTLATFPPKGSVRFSIKPVDGDLRTIRYQYGREPDENWQVGASSMYIEGFDSTKDFLFVQQALQTLGKENQIVWSDTYTYQYDYLSSRWSLIATKAKPKQKSNPLSFDVKGLALLPSGRSENFYTYVAGGAFQMNGPVGKVLGHTGITFSKGPPKSVWVKSQQYLGLSLGMADPLTVTKKIQVIPEIGYGVIFHFLEADFDQDGSYTFEFFVDQQFTFSLYLTYALNERYKLFIAPMGVAFFEKNDFAFMYGCQAGLRVSL